jgi:hypothetical protein
MHFHFLYFRLCLCSRKRSWSHLAPFWISLETLIVVVPLTCRSGIYDAPGLKTLKFYKCCSVLPWPTPFFGCGPRGEDGCPEIPGWGLWAFKLKTNQDGFSDASRMRKRAPKDPRQKPSGLQETFKRPKISRRWSQARLTMNLGGAKGPPGRSKTAQDGIKSAPESEEKA